ncbi:4-hydroxy-2-oxovalerate aldolase [Actinomycetota bacterium]|nr:4-hydroxy-2-oxovalerate aldolase [Actinomycetota bacterium]
MDKIKFFDSTLRDGSHSIQHQLTKQNIEDYCKGVNGAGMNAVIVGHGNGLGASSIQVGLSLLPDNIMLETARVNLPQTPLGIYMIPGFGTIHDDLIPAIEQGVDVFTIGCHCTEANTTKQHIEFLVSQGKETYGVLMMYHTASTQRILEEAKKMQEYGARGVFLMDSAGASTPEMVKRTVSTLKSGLDIEIGFHAHNNMGLAVGNSYTALTEGATLMDGTLRGFGAGAGNLQIEALIAILEQSGVNTGVKLNKLLHVSNEVMNSITGFNVGVGPLSVATGMNGVFSAFTLPILRESREKNIDPFELIEAVGTKRLVGGQEDIIIEIAENLSRQNEDSVIDSQMASLS